MVPTESNKILEGNQYQNFGEAPFIFYSDLECFIEKIDWSINNPEKSSRTKVGEHSPSAFWIATILSFLIIDNKHEKNYGNVMSILKTARKEDNKIFKSPVINKLTAEIMLKLTNLLYF